MKYHGISWNITTSTDITHCSFASCTPWFLSLAPIAHPGKATALEKVDLAKPRESVKTSKDLWDAFSALGNLSALNGLKSLKCSCASGHRAMEFLCWGKDDCPAKEPLPALPCLAFAAAKASFTLSDLIHDDKFQTCSIEDPLLLKRWREHRNLHLQPNEVGSPVVIQAASTENRKAHKLDWMRAKRLINQLWRFEHQLS